ncbi:hypothetical protein QE382_002285 [Sphingobacterium zeae]|uniref:Uncharacterized protein n=1 Tax=Sphingobacterium zeae TaxID=1776859 RepID=A0ABU0U5Q4_9SPHI|nr:hypothetical protein [Sphingobacterium zeae]
MKSKLLLFPSLLAILISCSKRVNNPFIPEEKNQLDSIYQAPKDIVKYFITNISQPRDGGFVLG